MFYLQLLCKQIYAELQSIRCRSWVQLILTFICRVGSNSVDEIEEHLLCSTLCTGTFAPSLHQWVDKIDPRTMESKPAYLTKLHRPIFDILKLSFSDEHSALCMCVCVCVCVLVSSHPFISLVRACQKRQRESQQKSFISTFDFMTILQPQIPWRKVKNNF